MDADSLNAKPLEIMPAGRAATYAIAPKFVQLAGTSHQLFALDADGRVWVRKPEMRIKGLDQPERWVPVDATAASA